PSRSRFRPPNPLAFRFRVQPSGPASTYSRSVLGASRNLRPPHIRLKTPAHAKTPLCTLSRLRRAYEATLLRPLDGETIKSRRAGGTSVPRAHWLSASAYSPQARLRPTRAPCSAQIGI